jgi:DHA1 family tetracycline resistance protein-like MFS transporter
MKKEKLIILFTVSLDVLGMGIVIPILPYYVKNFSASPLAVTWLFSIFALFSFFSAPFLGALSDRIGRRPSMIISICSTAVGWLIFASAKSLPLLFLGRIIDGCAAGNFSTAQSYLSDIAQDEKERTSNMGIIGMIFGIGLFVGPMIGSLLAKVSLSFPFWFVGLLATVNAIMAYKFLPETHPGSREGKLSIHPFTPIINASKDAVLRSRYITWFLFSLAFASQQTVFSLYLADVFGFDVHQSGWLFATMGIIMAVNQGYLLKRFWLKRFSENFLEVWLFPVFAMAFLAFASGNVYIFFLGLAINGFTQTIVRAVISSRSAGLAGPKRRGEVMGIMASIMSLAMFVSPIFAGYLYNINRALPFYYGAICLVAAFFVIRFCCFTPKNEHLVQDDSFVESETITA